MHVRSFPWLRALGWVIVFPLALVFSLPGASVLTEMLARAYEIRWPMPIELAVIGVIGVVLTTLLFSRWLFTRGLSWAIVFMGHAALANALAPGRQADWQLIWLAVGAGIGAVAGMLVVPWANGFSKRPQPSESPEGVAASGSAPRSRRPQFEITRGALGVGAVAVCALVALALRDEIRAARQSRITQAVVRTAGTTTYDHRGTPTLLFKWLDTLPRSEDYHCLSCVELGAESGDEELAELVRIGLGSLPHLHEIRLRNSRVSDDGLMILASLPNLRRLTVSRVTTDAGLAHVERLLGLQHLDLSETRITGQGLHHASRLPELLFLSLRQTRVSDDDLQALQSFPELICLDLSETQITDAGLVHLKQVPHLRSLMLLKTRISDAGLKHLAEIPHLTWLFISDTRTTLAGIREFRDLRPSVWIDR